MSFILNELNSEKCFFKAAICNIIDLIVVIFGKYSKTIFRQQIEFSAESKFQIF